MLGGGIIQIGLRRADERLCQEVSRLSEVKAAGFMPSTSEVGGENLKATLKVEARRQANTALVQVIQLFNDLSEPILSMETLEPNLETVFLHLTGKTLRQ